MRTIPGEPGSIEAEREELAAGIDVLLRDGSTLRVRTVAPDDVAALLRFLERLAPETLALRFGGATAPASLGPVARSLADPAGGLALVATTGADGEIVGHAAYLPLDRADRADRAEVAFLVADDLQGHGLGSALLGRLARAASAQGIEAFEASVHPGNHRMLNVFRDSGFGVSIQAEPDEVAVTFPTGLTDPARRAFEEREWTAAVAAARAFLHPSTVAVIGASRERGTISGEVFHNLLSYGFVGPVLPVNPKADVVQSVRAYPDVEDIPGPVDLAVIVVPAAAVLGVAEACARKGVRALVVITAGFGEVGEAGQERQRRLLEICRRSGMRLIGPNCMGILNTHPDVRLNATFAPVPPPAGRVGFMSQSGALGLAVMDHAGTLGLGLSSFVSVGNKADVSGNDLVRYWSEDDGTDVILLYLESFGNPRKFSTIARRVAREKPIVAVKSGRSPAGQRASGSHTGALIAASDVTVDALFRQAGVIRTDTLEQMFDVASLLANQTPPAGRRVAILTNAGGPGILCADTCVAEGLEVPVLSGATRERLREVLAGEASVANPVDMIASATAEQYRRAIRIVGEDPGVDAIIVIFIPPLVTRAEDAAAALVEGARELVGRKTVLGVFMQSGGVPAALREADVRVPAFAFPEDAAIALARAARYGEWRARPLAEPYRPDDVRRDEAVSIVASALGRGGGWLGPAETAALLSCYGLPVLPQAVVDAPGDVGRAARGIGGRVALKAIAPGLVHKTDAGAVRLDLSPEEAEASAAEMAARLAGAGTPPSGYLVQRMAGEGVEMIVGVVHDPQFGPVVACGAGGVLVELVGDVSVRLTPLARPDAEGMVAELRTRPLLDGYRGAPVRDTAALVDAILRVGALVDDLASVRELDLNPILVGTDGATIVDARVRVEASTERRPASRGPASTG